MKKPARKKGFISAETFNTIYDLYWEDGHSQYELAREFNIDQSYICRIVNNQVQPHQNTLLKKEANCKKTIKPKTTEPKQATTLRAKRNKLHSTKLTWNKVVKLRKLYFDGSFVQTALAKKFGVNQSTITQIITGKKWKENK